MSIAAFDERLAALPDDERKARLIELIAERDAAKRAERQARIAARKVEKEATNVTTVNNHAPPLADSRTEYRWTRDDAKAKAQTLADAGYHFLRLLPYNLPGGKFEKNRGKAPGTITRTGWGLHWSWNKPEEKLTPKQAFADVDRETKYVPNLGALMGLAVDVDGRQGFVTAIDVDTADENTIALLSDLFGHNNPIRRGERGGTFICVTDESESRDFARSPDSEHFIEDDKNAIQFLRLGRQTVMAGIHPKTLKPFRWETIGTAEPAQIPAVDDLPVVTSARLETLLASRGFERGSSSKTTSPEDKAALSKREKEIIADLDKVAPADFEDVNADLGIDAILEEDAPLRARLTVGHDDIEDHNANDLAIGNMLRRHLGARFDHHALRAVLGHFDACAAEEKQTNRYVARIAAKMEREAGHSEGEAFTDVPEGTIEASDEADAAELKADKRSKILADIVTLEMDIVKDTDAIVFGEPGAEESLCSHERQLKQKRRELEQLDKTESEREKARSGFLFSKDFENYKVPDDRIENMIPSVGVTIIVGDSNVGKTFALLEMVRALETGEKFLGHNVESCGAILITAEGLGGIGRRLAAMRLRWPDVSIAVHTVLPDFGSDANAALRKIEAYANEYEALHGRPVKFIALDNLLLMSGKLDANKGENASSILKPLQAFAHKHGVACVVAAHENRQGKESGSYAWRALTDNMMFLKRKGGIRFLTGDKERDGPANGEARFKLKVIGLGENRWKNPVSSCVVEPSIGPEMPAVTDDEDAPTISRPDRLEHRLQDVLDIFEREGERQKATDESTWAAARRIELPVSEIQAAVNARRTAEGLVALGRSTVNDHVKAAVEKGDLEAVGTAARPLYKLA